MSNRYTRHVTGIASKALRFPYHLYYRTSCRRRVRQVVEPLRRNIKWLVGGLRRRELIGDGVNVVQALNESLIFSSSWPGPRPFLFL